MIFLNFLCVCSRQIPNDFIWKYIEFSKTVRDLVNARAFSEEYYYDLNSDIDLEIKNAAILFNVLGLIRRRKVKPELAPDKDG